MKMIKKFAAAAVLLTVLVAAAGCGNEKLEEMPKGENFLVVQKYYGKLECADDISGRDTNVFLAVNAETKLEYIILSSRSKDGYYIRSICPRYTENGNIKSQRRYY